MEVYNVNELKEKLKETILKLGIDEKYKNHGAFEAFLEEIDSFIMRMNTNDLSNIRIKNRDSKISFSTGHENDVRYTMEVSYDIGKETLNLKTTKEEKPFQGKEYNIVRTKSLNHLELKIDKKYDFAVLTKYSAFVDNVDCKYNECNVHRYFEESRYTPYGYMQDCEKIDLDNSKEKNVSFDEFNNLASISKSKYYISRQLMRRNTFDTAYVLEEDRKTGLEYRAVLPLQIHSCGLRDMHIHPGYLEHPTEIFIPRLTEEKIEQIINQETNEKIKEWIRKEADSRKEYSYYSIEDKDFLYEDGTKKSFGR